MSQMEISASPHSTGASWQYCHLHRRCGSQEQLKKGLDVLRDFQDQFRSPTLSQSPLAPASAGQGEIAFRQNLLTGAALARESEKASSTTKWLVLLTAVQDSWMQGSSRRLHSGSIMEEVEHGVACQIIEANRLIEQQQRQGFQRVS